MVSTKQTFIFVYNFGAFLGICPNWDFTQNCPKKKTILELSINCVVNAAQVIVFAVDSRSLYLQIICPDTKLQEYVYSAMNLIFELNSFVLFANRWNPTWVLLMEKVVQNSDNRYWHSDRILDNKIGCQFFYGNCVWIVILLLIISHYILQKLVIDVFHFAVILRVFILYLLFIKVILIFSILWAINNNFNSIILSLRNVSTVEFLKELQIKFKNTVEMIYLFNQLFGLVIFSILALNLTIIQFVLHFIYKYKTYSNIMPIELHLFFCFQTFANIVKIENRNFVFIN